MKHFLIKSSQQSISSWQGGSTTQLFIYPDNCSYALRNFDFRISSASVNISPSEFTKLNGYTRLIMPIDSPLTLNFLNLNKAEYASDVFDTVRLLPFEVFKFDGGTKTISNGICTDIGIMFKSEVNADIQLASEKSYDVKQFAFIYALKDNVEVKLKNLSIALNQNDFLVLKNDFKRSETFSLKLLFKNSAVVLFADLKN